MTRSAGGPGGQIRASGVGPTRHGSSATTPYTILSVILLVSAAFAAMFAAVPDPDSSLAVVDALIAVVLVLAAAVVWFLAPRIPDDWGLDIAIVMSTGIAAYGATQVSASDGQFLVGLGLVLFAVVAAYFRPRRRFLAELAFMSIAYSLAIVVNPVLRSPLDLLVILAVLWGVSIMVSVLAQQLRDLALHDSLTGVLNRRGLDMMAASVLATAARVDEVVAVGIFDLDEFKIYNDTHGHLAGDRLLAEVAQQWSRHLRSSDLLARYGGDEFAVLLVGATAASAQELTTRVRADDTSSWTIGWTELAPGESLFAAMGRADEMLLAAKRASRG